MSVPFLVQAVYTSFADMTGVARIEDDFVVLEFEVKDNVFGILKTQPKEIRIPFTELAEVTFRRGWFRGVLVIRAKRMSALADIPGHDGAELRMSCRRRHRDAAQDLASQISMRMVARDLQRMVAQTDRVIIPPSTTPPTLSTQTPRQPSPPTGTTQQH